MVLINLQNVDQKLTLWPFVSLETGENYLGFEKECLKIGLKKHYKKGQVITRVGDYVSGAYLLSKGKTVTTVMGQNGLEKTVYFCKAPWFFNDAPAALNQEATMAVRALSDCVIVIINTNDLNDLLHSDKSYLDLYLQYISKRVYSIVNELTEVWNLNPTQIVFKVLVCFAIEQGISDNEQVVVKITQEELAQICGLHRVTVARTFKRLKELDMIKKTNKSTVVMSSDLSFVSFYDL
ncbi:MAG: Crp/Fnr family transcriptional regulator [Gracilibacteraceae bacterium]|jgi:CRP-like cAMP-binding protein|nr:Crp/Fnr family transcriptional regulator [Gracilibacteraceae bacterium]